MNNPRIIIGLALWVFAACVACYHRDTFYAGAMFIGGGLFTSVVTTGALNGALSDVSIALGVIVWLVGLVGMTQKEDRK
jgi:hypothetical protein